MATLDFVAAASHAPGVVGWPNKIPEEMRREMDSAYHLLGSRIAESNLDLLIVICNDHGSNFPLDECPDLAFVVSDRHVGPAEWFKPWLDVTEEFELTGARHEAQLLIDALSDAGLGVQAHDGPTLYDDNLTTPTKMLGLEASGVKIIPVLHNTMVPPVPNERACYEFGRALHSAVRTALPDDMRVGLLATGGLSHEPGGARYMLIDEEFDRRFLDFLSRGAHEDLLNQITYEDMEAAGAGGTAELLSWLIAAGAVGAVPSETLFYEAILEFRCGVGVIDWNVGRQLTDVAS